MVASGHGDRVSLVGSDHVILFFHIGRHVGAEFFQQIQILSNQLILNFGVLNEYL